MGHTMRWNPTCKDIPQLLLCPSFAQSVCVHPQHQAARTIEQILSKILNKYFPMAQNVHCNCRPNQSESVTFPRFSSSQPPPCHPLEISMEVVFSPGSKKFTSPTSDDSLFKVNLEHRLISLTFPPACGNLVQLVGQTL